MCELNKVSLIWPVEDHEDENDIQVTPLKCLICNEILIITWLNGQLQIILINGWILLFLKVRVSWCKKKKKRHKNVVRMSIASSVVILRKQFCFKNALLSDVCLL